MPLAGGHVTALVMIPFLFHHSVYRYRFCFSFVHPTVQVTGGTEAQRNCRPVQRGSLPVSYDPGPMSFGQSL